MADGENSEQWKLYSGREKLGNRLKMNKISKKNYNEKEESTILFLFGLFCRLFSRVERPCKGLCKLHPSLVPH